MRSQAASGWVVGSLLLTACGEAAELAKVGELCVESPDCRDELVCDYGVCADDSGPQIYVFTPVDMTAFAYGQSILLTASLAGDPLAADDSLELTLDPHGPAPVTTAVIENTETYTGKSYTGTVPGPAEPGSYWLRVRVLDGEGQPYPNPSATQYVNVFVRDPVHPDKPLLALLEPRPDRQHRYGEPVEVEVGVLPGSFIFTNFVGVEGDCHSLPGCADPFAPECEDECGPIARVGHVKVYLRDDYPGCLLDMPIDCNADYVTTIWPGPGNQSDAYILNGTISAEQLEVGKLELTAALSYDNHAPYPSREALIYTTQTLTIVDPAN